MLGFLAGSKRPLPQPPASPRLRADRGAADGWHARDEAIMGTAIHVEAWHEDPAVARAACDDVIAEMHRIDAAMSPHRPDSELSRINDAAATRAVPLSPEMAALLGRALDFSALSDGAFDISYAAVGQLYDYRLGRRPDDAARAEACRAVGWRHLHLDREARTLRFGLPGMRIDLGGFAKGHAVDNGVALLRRRGVRHGIVSAGGDSHVLGDRLGRPWSVAVRDPRREGEVVAVLPLVDCAISTSGDYERFFDEAGVRHHHLLDPRTGESPRAVRSVTILADEGLASEAFSKAVFVLGAQAGLALVERHPGIDAVVVDAQGRLHFSSGLARATPGAATP